MTHAGETAYPHYRAIKRKVGARWEAFMDEYAEGSRSKRVSESISGLRLTNTKSVANLRANRRGHQIRVHR
jgi:hypothetical protein